MTSYSMACFFSQVVPLPKTAGIFESASHGFASKLFRPCFRLRNDVSLALLSLETNDPWNHLISGAVL